MRELFIKGRITIDSGQAVSCIPEEAHKVRIKSGKVWITVEGVSHDYWLFAGDSLTLIPGALTVMEADGAASRVELAAAGKGSVLAQLYARWAHIVQRFGRSRNASATLSRGACGT